MQNSATWLSTIGATLPAVRTGLRGSHVNTQYVRGMPRMCCPRKARIKLLETGAML